MANNNSFNFEQLLGNAVQSEISNQEDDTEDYPFQSICQTDQPDTPAPSDQDSDVDINSDEHQTPTSSTATPISRQPPAKSVNEYRKLKSKQKRQMKRQQERSSRSFGDYTVRPSTTKKHVKEANKVTAQLDLDVDAVSVTKIGYTTVNADGYNRTFTLEEIVGSDSVFKFTLHHWDGK
jgi:ribosomal protein L44E